MKHQGSQEVSGVREAGFGLDRRHALTYPLADQPRDHGGRHRKDGVSYCKYADPPGRKRRPSGKAKKAEVDEGGPEGRQLPVVRRLLDDALSLAQIPVTASEVVGTSGTRR